MAITVLSRVINETFVKTLTRAGSSSSPSASVAGGTSLGAKSEVSLSAGLRIGARDFGAAVQLLNNGVSVVNVARSANEKLLEIVGKIEGVVRDASKGGVTVGKARRLRAAFEDAAREFNAALKQSADQKLDVFDVDDLSAVLTRGGLEPAKVSEIALAFKKITPLTKSRVDSEGKVTSRTNLIPTDEFARALKQAVFDPEDPLAEDPVGSFVSVREKLKDLRESLRSNVRSLDDTAEVVSKNIDLVRVVGLAMLDLSSSLSTKDTAVTVAEELQARIRQGAPLLVEQAHNLQAIAVAGLTAMGSQDSK